MVRERNKEEDVVTGRKRVWLSFGLQSTKLIKANFKDILHVIFEGFHIRFDLLCLGWVVYKNRFNVITIENTNLNGILQNLSTFICKLGKKKERKKESWA